MSCKKGIEYRQDFSLVSNKICLILINLQFSGLYHCVFTGLSSVRKTHLSFGKRKIPNQTSVQSFNHTFIICAEVFSGQKHMRIC